MTRRIADLIAVQVQRYGDVWMVRWLDADRSPPAGMSPGKREKSDDCAACRPPRSRATTWMEREIAASALPSPLMCAWCSACNIVTWYASVPAERLRFAERAS